MKWDEQAINKMILDGIEESLTLDYKSGEALSREKNAKTEVTKDVSAMANSDGGTIIYGVAEFKDPKRRYLPEKIIPVDHREFSKEWLENIIDNIRPRIDGVIIHPIRLAAVQAASVYVVEIPRSSTAHQANDHKYYKRHNFASVPMEDYEIRDVMARGSSPKIDISFVIRRIVNFSTSATGVTRITRAPLVTYYLVAVAMNSGKILARYVNVDIWVPTDLIDKKQQAGEAVVIDGRSYRRYSEENTKRDVVGRTEFGRDEYGPSWYAPLLPGRTRTWNIRIDSTFSKRSLQELLVIWGVHADNAEERSGRVLVSEIPVANGV